MTNAVTQVPSENEPVKSYAPGPRRRSSGAPEEMAPRRSRSPLIGARRSGAAISPVPPAADHRRSSPIHRASSEHVRMAVAAAREAWTDWQAMAWEARAPSSSRRPSFSPALAADSERRDDARTEQDAFQAEIDSACELIDFYRFTPLRARTSSSSPTPLRGCGTRGARPLEGFVFAAPRSTSPPSPATSRRARRDGNVCLWKPASSAVYSAYLSTAPRGGGAPPGSSTSSRSGGRSEPRSREPRDGGIHFTGRPRSSRHVRTVGEHPLLPFLPADRRRDRREDSSSRTLGRCAGLVTALVRGRSSTRGRSARPRAAPSPRVALAKVKADLLATVRELKMGDPADFTNSSTR